MSGESLQDICVLLRSCESAGSVKHFANAVIDLDKDKLRSEPGSVIGIGEKRLEHIMEIIEEYDRSGQLIIKKPLQI